MVLVFSFRAASVLSLWSLSRADSLASCSSEEVDDALETEASLAQVSLLSGSHQMFRFNVDDSSEAKVVLHSDATESAIKAALDEEFLSPDNSESGVEFMARVQADEEAQLLTAENVLVEAAGSGIASYAGTDKLLGLGSLADMEEMVKEVATEELEHKLEVEGAVASSLPDIERVLHNESVDSSLNMDNLDAVVSQAIETEYKTLEYYGSHQEFLDYVKTREGEEEQEDIAKRALKELTGKGVDPNQKAEVELLQAMEAEVGKVAAQEEMLEAQEEVLEQGFEAAAGAASEVPALVAEDHETVKDFGQDERAGLSDSVREAVASPQVSSGFSVAKEASSVVTGSEGDFVLPL